MEDYSVSKWFIERTPQFMGIAISLLVLYSCILGALDEDDFRKTGKPERLHTFLSNLGELPFVIGAVLLLIFCIWCLF